LVIPLALACKEPTLLPSASISLVMPKKKNASPEKLPPAPFPEIASSKANAVEDSLTKDIFAVIDKLKARGTLTPVQANNLKRLQTTKSNLLVAAFSVAVNAEDTEYLAEIFCDIADSLSSEEGRQACEAQDEVLQVAEQLYDQNNITESQLLYLRHLVLIRDESVAVIYDKYQENMNLDELGQRLYDLVHAHPAGSKKVDTKAESGEAIPRETVMKVVRQLLGKGKITGAEASILMDLANANDEFVREGFLIYKGDEDSPSFEDYIVRCIQTEIESRLNPFSDNAETSTADGENDDEDRDNDGDDSSIPDSWKGVVPANFVKLVFRFYEEDGVLSEKDASTLCDLYQSGYDMVRAAWEVYVVQEDKADFLDTVSKIVRGMNTSASAPTTKASPSTKSTEASPAAAAEKKDAPAATSGAENEEERRQKAMNAVAAAKRELLKHSLEMMVKQNIISQDKALMLFKRLLQGDQLIDAAIEAYAADRNVSEFLDTLFILSNHSEEDLNKMLQYAREEAKQSTDQSSSSESKAPEISSTKEEKTDPSLMEARIYIRQVIIEITQQRIISAEVASLLLELLSKDDERLLAVYEVYTDSQDLADFVDSLLRIAQHEMKKALGLATSSSPQTAKATEKASVSTSAPSSPSKDMKYDESLDVEEEGDESIDSEDDDEDDKDDEEEESDDPLLGPEDQKSIVQILVR
jgi:hypothetical protein